MLICKNTDNLIKYELFFDEWKVSHKDTENGEDVLIEEFDGQVKIEKTEEQRYLGFVLSSKGNNMVNIEDMKKKSKGIIRKIFNKLDSLNLRKYYFECALLFLKVMLRSSILYACETYYNLKETEIRQLEMIEEGFLRELIRTGKGCPISQLYTEVSLIPARLEIIKLRLLFLQYILNQKENSTIFMFLKLQFQQPTKGDWGSACIKNLKELNIEESLEDIKLMTKQKFKNILNERIIKAAIIYLKGKQGSKGKEIEQVGLSCAKLRCLQLDQQSLWIDFQKWHY